MDRRLRSELAAIARDTKSGASQLALRGVKALQEWLRQHAQPSEQELLEAARVLLKAQPSMAPVLRLANEVALAVDAQNPAAGLARRLEDFHNLIRTASSKIAEYFYRALPRRPLMAGVTTYSYSSTVVRALIRARSRIHIVYCSESRPRNEGRSTARTLAHAGMRVMLSTDAALLAMPVICRYLVLGADKIMYGGFENKIGTSVLVERARKASPPSSVWILADTTKFWPESWYRPQFSRFKPGSPSEIWKNAPRNVWISNLYFWRTRLVPSVRILTERGWMTPGQVRRELRKIRVSPRLKSLID